MQYFEPNFLDEALVLLDRFAPDAFALAGGTILGPRLRANTGAATLINLKRIRPLHDISADDAARVLHVGPLVTARDLSEEQRVIEHAPLLAAAASALGAPQLRNVATVGGNLNSGISSADLSVALLALDARCIVAGEAAGPRTIAIDDFFAQRASFDPRWLLTGIELSYSAARTAYQKMTTRRSFEIALVCVAVAIELSGASVARARIALGGAACTPVRARKAEQQLETQGTAPDSIARAAQRAAQDDAAPRSDHRASADYRRQLVRVLVERALRAALGETARAAR